jgi:ferrous-iron efflux pump FieF
MISPDPLRRARLLRLATRASVATALLLIVAKVVAWLLTGSVSVLASLVDSVMDALASGINLVAVRWSLQPADEEHRFGHGKAESLAGLGQATFIAGSALFLVLQAVQRILDPQPLGDVGVGVGVMVFAMAATGGLLLLQRHVIAVTGSSAIKADSLHYFTDLATNASILLALGLAWAGWPGLDPYFALAVAAYILRSAWHIGSEAVHLLMDRELSAETQAQILGLAYSDPGVLGVHDLKTRQSGPTAFIQLHLELDDSQSLTEAHATTEAVEQALLAAFPGAEVMIHQDPISVVNRARVQTAPAPAGRGLSPDDASRG